MLLFDIKHLNKSVFKRFILGITVFFSLLFIILLLALFFFASSEYKNEETFFIAISTSILLVIIYSVIGYLLKWKRRLLHNIRSILLIIFLIFNSITLTLVPLNFAAEQAYFYIDKNVCKTFNDIISGKNVKSQLCNCSKTKKKGSNKYCFKKIESNSKFFISWIGKERIFLTYKDESFHLIIPINRKHLLNNEIVIEK